MNFGKYYLLVEHHLEKKEEKLSWLRSNLKDTEKAIKNHMKAHDCTRSQAIDHLYKQHDKPKSEAWASSSEHFNLRNEIERMLSEELSVEEIVYELKQMGYQEADENLVGEIIEEMGWE